MQRKKYDKEHVTPFIKKLKYKKKFNLKNNYGDYSSLRLTVDEKADIEFIKKIINAFKNKKIDVRSVINFYKTNKSFFKYSLSINRNEGSNLQKGTKTLDKSKKFNCWKQYAFFKEIRIIFAKVLASLL